MSSQNPRIPEPDLPESELIRAADSLPKLSSGLRSSTLVLCAAQVRRTQQIRRVKIASVAVVAASAVFAVWALFAPATSGPDSPMVEDDRTPQTNPAWTSPADPGAGTEAAGVISFGAPRQSSPSSDVDNADRSIERLHKRAQDVMDAGLVPSF